MRPATTIVLIALLGALTIAGAVFLFQLLSA